jgi:ankyrin repeat protein
MIGKVDFNAEDIIAQKLLTWAAQRGSSQAAVKLLLATGKIDVNARDMFDKTPLSCAAENSYELCSSCCSQQVKLTSS